MKKEREDKKMEKKILAIIASMAMVVVLFTGCPTTGKKSKEVNKTETKTEAPVETAAEPAGFETAADEKRKTGETSTSKSGNKKAKDDFDMGLDEEKKEESSEKKPKLKQNFKSKSAPKPAIPNKNKPASSLKKGEKQISDKEIENMAAFLKGLQQGKMDGKQKKNNQGAATPAGGEQKKQEPEKVVKSQETANQGAATPAGGEQKKQQEPEKVVKPVPNEGAAPVKEQKLVEPKKN